MKDKEIMEASEVAKYLHLHLFTVHKLARQGKLPGFKIGNDWRFRRESIEAWVKNKEKQNISIRTKAQENRSPENSGDFYLWM